MALNATNVKLPTPSTLPIVGHFEVQATGEESERIERLAQRILLDPSFTLDARLASVAAARDWDRPALHIDDLSAIAVPRGATPATYLEDRARLRAGDGDIVVTSEPAVEGYHEYCAERLGLGRPAWLVVEAEGSLAVACWKNRGIRNRLCRAIRREELAYIHPHMGNRLVWELAAQLREATHRPFGVLGPPPAVAQFANDKISFARAVSGLLGPSYIPRTENFCNLSMLTRRLAQLSPRMRYLAVKLPDSVAGAGNFVIDSATIRGRSLASIRRRLKGILRDVPWNESRHVLAGCWETNVVAAPSAQLWIPEREAGAPIVEGIFVQSVEGEVGSFCGTQPADFEEGRLATMARQSWLLGRLFQRLGYVGRCSFDMVLVGQSPSRSRIKFIECNGRWGGTSLPMTLANRLFGDWQRRPFAVRDRALPAEKSFEEVANSLGNELFDARTGRGDLVLLTPGRMVRKGVLTLMAAAATARKAETRVEAALSGFDSPRPPGRNHRRRRPGSESKPGHAGRKR
jgi:hypothetical protein